MSATCRYCGEDIWEYVHSQAGPYKATAWTSVPEDSDTDQRYGTLCAERGGIHPHRPEAEEDTAE